MSKLNNIDPSWRFRLDSRQTFGDRARTTAAQAARRGASGAAHADRGRGSSCRSPKRRELDGGTAHGRPPAALPCAGDECGHHTESTRRSRPIAYFEVLRVGQFLDGDQGGVFSTTRRERKRNPSTAAQADCDHPAQWLERRPGEGPRPVAGRKCNHIVERSRRLVVVGHGLSRYHRPWYTSTHGR